MKIKEVIKKFLKMDAYCGFLNLMSIQYAFNVNVMFVLSQSSQRSPCWRFPEHLSSVTVDHDMSEGFDIH